MELRRALLLFAIVLGVAAVVASLSSPQSPEPDRTPASEPRAAGTDRPRPRTLTFDGSKAPETKPLQPGTLGTIVVRVDEPSTVEISGLGLIEDAAPGTPAQFSVLASQPGRYAVRRVVANGARGRTLGVLVIERSR